MEIIVLIIPVFIRQDFEGMQQSHNGKQTKQNVLSSCNLLKEPMKNYYIIA